MREVRSSNNEVSAKNGAGRETQAWRESGALHGRGSVLDAELAIGQRREYLEFAFDVSELGRPPVSERLEQASKLLTL
jgi:hypothetical protein